jgi:hypothetical protein
MLEVLFIHYKEIGKIILMFIIIVSIYGAIHYKRLRAHIIDHWPEYRSHPLLMPFAGFINPEKGTSGVKSTFNNFRRVLSNLVASFFKILMKPINAIIKIFLQLFKIITGILNKIRAQINVMRNFLFKLFENMYIRLQNGIAAITYLFLKMREGMKRSFGLFNLVLSIMDHSMMFFESLVKGPVGAFGKIAQSLGWASSIYLFGPLGQLTWSNALDICFSPNTIMRLENGYNRRLDGIVLGDILKGKHTVVAKLDVKYIDTSIYKLDNIEVTANHVVHYKDHWIRVKNHPDAVKIGYNLDKVICLVTDTGFISIENHLFKDYLDTHDPLVHREMDRIIQTMLNNGDDCGYSLSKDLLTGFVENSHIYNDDILGSITIDPAQLTMYEIDKQLISSNMLILENGKWVRAYSHSRAIYIGPVTKKCINYITKSEKIYLDNGLVLRDFVEIRNKSVNSLMDHYIDSSF